MASRTCEWCGQYAYPPCNSAQESEGCSVRKFTLEERSARSLTEGAPHADPVDPKHYNQFAIEPIEFINKNKLEFNEGNVVKYISRHRFKNGAEDVRKAIQYCKFILRYQYGIED